MSVFVTLYLYLSLLSINFLAGKRTTFFFFFFWGEKGVKNYLGQLKHEERKWKDKTSMNSPMGRA